MAADSLGNCIAIQTEVILMKFTTLLPNNIRRIAPKILVLLLSFDQIYAQAQCWKSQFVCAKILSWSPPPLRVLPFQVNNLLLAESREFFLGTRRPLLTLLVVIFHPEECCNSKDCPENGTSEVYTITNLVLGRIGGKECPCRNETADVAKHDYNICQSWSYVSFGKER